MTGQLRRPLTHPAIGVGIVGYGSIGRVHRAAIEACEGARVIAVSRRATESGEPGEPEQSDYSALLDRDDIHVVVVCSPSGDHAAHALAALRAGKHVVIEKPLAMSVRDADELISISLHNGLLLAPIVQRRFEPRNQAIKQLIEQGTLGRPVLGEALIRWTRSQEYYDSAAWRGTHHSDGGVLLNQALHAIDLLCWWLGPTLDSAGMGATLTHDIEAEDTAVGVLRFTSGALGVVSATTSAHHGTPEQLNLFFDRGSFSMSGAELVDWRFPDVPEPVAHDASPSGAADPADIGFAGHRRQWADVLHSLRTGADSEASVTPSSAVDSLEAILRMREVAE